VDKSKSAYLYQISAGFCVPKIIQIGSNFLLSYSRKTGWQFLKKVVYRADHVIYVF